MNFRANYNDGTSLEWSDDQRDPTYLKIDRKKLESFELTYNGKTIHKLRLRPGENLFLRRRVVRFLSGGVHEFYLVGCTSGIANVLKTVTFVFDDGHTESMTEWGAAPFEG